MFEVPTSNINRLAIRRAHRERAEVFAHIFGALRRPVFYLRRPRSRTVSV